MIRPNGREPCRDLSVGRDEPLTATAAPTQRWLVLEQPGAWGANAPRESGLDPALGDALARAMTAIGGRLLLARRPPGPERNPDPPFRWFAYDATRPGAGVRAGDVAQLDPTTLPGLLGDVDAPLPGTRYPHDLVLVCTHGRHDPCCAESGRDAVRALIEHGATDLWECSHIGGDRFAGNILLLPQGMYFGRVDGGAAGRWEAARRSRQVELAHYRGRATVSMFAQAAEHHVREHFGLLGFDDVVPVAEEGEGRERRVVTVDAGQRFVLEVVRSGREPAFLTCAAERENKPAQYAVRMLGTAPDQR